MRGSPPPNEVRAIKVNKNGVRNGNDLTVAIGRKNSNNLRFVPRLVAFVTGSVIKDQSKPYEDLTRNELFGRGKRLDIGIL